jgi:sugar/nucleoside kinase (ribokinase family)
LALASYYNDIMAELEKVDLVGVGLNATDTLISLAEYPVRGSKLEYSNASIMPGGQVATTVVACQTWGLRTRYVGKLGDDHAACLHREAFDRVGVEARLITVSGGVSPQSLILVDAGGERTVLCRRDESMALKPEELKREWIVNARVLHVDGHETAAATLAASWAHDAGIPVVADLDETYPGVDDLIVNIDYLIVSKDFSCKLMQDNNLESALRRMQARYNCRLSAATLGEDGVMAWDGKRFYRSAAYRVPVVDTTGAGDIFRAGFIYGLMQEWPLDRQLDFSCAAAAMNCMAAGARGGIKTVEAVEKLMATVERYENGQKLPVIDVPVLDEQDVDRISR